MAAEGADDNQRQAGAERQGIKRQAAERGIAGLADIAQCKSQRRRHARADNQRREHAHHKHRGDFAAAQFIALVLEIALHGGGQLDAEEAEHRERKHHHQRGGGQHHPRLLQPHREQRAGEAGYHADQSVSERQPLHIHHRERKCAPFGSGFVAHHNARHNRNQRIHTGGEAQPQAREKKRQ